MPEAPGEREGVVLGEGEGVARGERDVDTEAEGDLEPELEALGVPVGREERVPVAVAVAEAVLAEVGLGGAVAVAVAEAEAVAVAVAEAVAVAVAALESVGSWRRRGAALGASDRGASSDWGWQRWTRRTKRRSAMGRGITKGRVIAAGGVR